ncbi:MAG: hypothetical protein JWM82_1816 [Myxococcales bacterium]|nr:hypothetical protein [Myxococcales bacterium]
MTLPPIRLPAVAGTFYPDDAQALAADARRLVSGTAEPRAAIAVVGYATSADAGGGKDRVVGYASIAIR